MPDEFKNFIIGAAIISLFSFLIIAASISLGEDYGKDISELEGDSLNLSGMNQTLQNINKSTSEFQAQFVDQKFSVLTGVIAIVQVFELFKAMWSLIMTPITLFTQLTVNVLHIHPIVIGVVMFIAIISIIFAIYSLIKKGD